MFLSFDNDDAFPLHVRGDRGDRLPVALFGIVILLGVFFELLTLLVARRLGVFVCRNEAVQESDFEIEVRYAAYRRRRHDVT